MSGKHVELPDIAKKILVTEEQISEKVRELGSRIFADYEGTDLRLLTVLKGGSFFLADLCRAIDIPLEIDFMAVSSYADGGPGNVRITKDLSDSIDDASVIVVEDIIDTGMTLNYILSVLRGRGPRSIEVCTLLDKDVRRIVDLPIAYRGFSIPDTFVVGYGLDVNGLYRNLPYVATVAEEAMVR